MTVPDGRVAEFHRLHCRVCVTTGRADNHVTLDDMIGHLRAVADAVAVPVNADFEGGFAVDPEHVFP